VVGGRTSVSECMVRECNVDGGGESHRATLHSEIWNVVNWRWWLVAGGGGGGGDDDVVVVVAAVMTAAIVSERTNMNVLYLQAQSVHTSSFAHFRDAKSNVGSARPSRHICLPVVTAVRRRHNRSGGKGRRHHPAAV
jgi:hypothetical protein